VAADLAFHDGVLQASANPFVPVLFSQLRQVLKVTRSQTSSKQDIRRRALNHHKLIRDAIAAHDEAAAREAMNAHLDQTWDDFTHYFRSSGLTDLPKSPAASNK
jgi:DNA-binding FadR family transcriptional regulator